jgi:hypothetical protein
MKSKILAIVAAGMLAGPIAANAIPVVDQSNPVGNAGFFGGAFWQQEVLVGLSGSLTGLEITFLTDDFFLPGTSSGTLYIWAGSPWQSGPSLFSTTYSGVSGAYFFDLFAAGIVFSAGDRFTFGLRGSLVGDIFQSGGIAGSYVSGGPVGGAYAGNLYWPDDSNPFSGVCVLDCGADLAFRTFVDSSVSVPEPGTLALLGLGLAGLGFARRRKLS